MYYKVSYYNLDNWWITSSIYDWSKFCYLMPLYITCKLSFSFGFCFVVTESIAFAGWVYQPKVKNKW